MAKYGRIELNDINDPVIRVPRCNSPEQYDFVTSKAKFVCGSGGFGGGKTWMLVLRALLLGIDSPIFGDCSGSWGLIGRHKEKDFIRTTLPEFKRIIPREWIRREYIKEGKLELINETVYWYAHLDDISNLQSINLNFAAADQMEQLLWAIFKTLAFERIRRKTYTRYRKNILLQPEFDDVTGECTSFDLDVLNAVCHYQTVFGVCNPRRGSWIYKTFVKNEEYKNDPNPILQRQYNSTFHLVMLDAEKNAANLPSDYFKIQRENKSEREYERDVKGLWNRFEGQIYIDFTDDLILKYNLVPAPWWDIYIGIDHGGTGLPDKDNTINITAVVFAAVEKITGRRFKIHVFNELYLPSSTIEETVRAIDEKLQQTLMLQRVHYKEDTEQRYESGEIRTRVVSWKCDPSMARKRDDSDESIMETYMRHGYERGLNISLSPGNNEVAPAIHKISWLFRKKMTDVNPRCIHFIGSHKAYEYGDNEKPANKQDDHECDAFKMLCSGMNFWWETDLSGLEKRESRESEQMRIAQEMANGGYNDGIYGNRFTQLTGTRM